MKKYIFPLLLSVVSFELSGQVRPDFFTEQTAPDSSNFEVYSQKNGLPRRANLFNLKKYLSPFINATPIGYTPTPTGNTLNLTEFVETAAGEIYYIDGTGKAVLLYDPAALQNISFSGDTLYLSDGGFVYLGGLGVSDGDYGDIDVTSSGTVWTLDTAAVSSLEVQDNTLTAADLLVDVVSSLDGVTNDGGNIDLVAGANVTITPNDGANTITIAATDTQLTEEQVEDFVGGMLTGNTETGITVTYEDADGTIDFVASDVSATNEGALTVLAGSGTSSVISSNTSGSTDVTLQAGANITISEVGNTITITAAAGTATVGDGDYGDIVVSGSGTVWDIDSGVVGSTEVTDNSLAAGDLAVNVVSSVDGVTNDGGNIDFIAGSNITITPDDGANTITIASTAAGVSDGDKGDIDVTSSGTVWTVDTAAVGSLEVTDNSLAAGDLLVDVVSSVDGVTNDGGNIDFIAGSNITITPDDGANTITIAATDTQLSEEQVEDFVGGMLTGNTETGITVTYEDVDGTIDFVASDVSATNEGSLTVTAGTASTSVISSNTSGSTDVTLEAGSNITISETGNTITIAATGGGTLGDGDYGDVDVSGTGTILTIDTAAVNSLKVQDNTLTAADLLVDVVSSVDGVTNDGGNIDLVAGANITITPDDGANTITIAASIGAAGNPIYGEAFHTTNDTLSITAGVPVKSDGMVVGNTNGVSYSAGRLTYSGATAVFFVAYSAEVYSNQTGSFTKVWIYKNGAAVANTYREEYVEAALERENIITSALISLDSLDYLEVFFDASENASVYLERGNFSMFRVGNSTSQGAALTDGDKGDIDVTSSGTVWTVDTAAVGSLEVTDNTLAAADLLVDVVSSVDGVTNDGGNIDFIAGSNVTITPDDGANTITIAATDTQLSQEQVEDFVGNMVTGNTETGITVTYEDVDGTIDFVASDVSATNEGSLTVTAGIASTSVISSNTSGSTDVTLSASTGLSISETGNTITLTNTGDTNTADDLTTSTSFSGDVSGLYNNLQLGSGVVGTAEVADNTLTAGDLAVNVVSSVEGVTNDGGNIDLVASGIVTITGDDGANTITIGVAKVKAIKAITVESPTSSENISMFFTDHAITITKVADVVRGTTPSVTYNIRHATTRDSGTPNNVFTANRTVTSTSGSTTTTFNDATIPANSWVWIITSATSGTIAEINITLQYEAD